MKNKRDCIAALFNASAGSGASVASVFALGAGHNGLGWLSASVAAVNLGSAVYGAVVAWRANHPSVPRGHGPG